jgi:transcriptional regulator with XRE-family HTH domain
MPTNLKKLREEKGLKQDEMARLLGYKSISKYNEIENGHRNLPIRKALKAAEILDCTLNDIFLR